MDVAPTILDLMGVPVSGRYAGTIVCQLEHASAQRDSRIQHFAVREMHDKETIPWNKKV